MLEKEPRSFIQALPWVGFVALMFWLNYSARATLSPLLVSVEQDLLIGHAASTSLLLMQGLGFCAALSLSGFCLCRIRPVHLAGLSIMASGLILICMPWADSMPKVRLIFLLFGFSAGFYFPAGMATLTSLVELKDIGKAVAVHELAPNLGFILIPLIAQGLLLLTNWRNVYAALGWLMAVVGVLFMLLARGGRSYLPPPSFTGIRLMLNTPATFAVFMLMAVATIGEFSVFCILQIFLVNSAGFQPEAANLAISISRLATVPGVIIGGLAADRLNPYRFMGGCLLLHAVALVMMCLPGNTLILAGVTIQAMAIAMFFPSIFKGLAQTFPINNHPILMSLTMPLAALISAGLMPVFLGWCGQYLSFKVGLTALALASCGSLWGVMILARNRLAK